jgi:MFS family permease
MLIHCVHDARCAAPKTPTMTRRAVLCCAMLCCCTDRVTKPFALLTIGILVAQAVSGPVAAAFLAMNGLGGLHGWQWLFLLEGLPTVCLSVVVWCYLPDCPNSVTWLTEGDKKLHEASVSAAQGSGCAGVVKSGLSAPKCKYSHTDIHGLGVV